MPPIDPAQTMADARSRVKAEWREALAILTPILAVLLWLVYGHQFGLLRAARKARTREDVRNLRLKYPIVLSHAVENHVVGQADSRFGAYRYGFYRKEHAFTWRLDANYKVVAYERNSETFLFRFSLSDEEYR